MPQLLKDEGGILPRQQLRRDEEIVYPQGVFEKEVRVRLLLHRAVPQAQGDPPFEQMRPAPSRQGVEHRRGTVPTAAREEEAREEAGIRQALELGLGVAEAPGGEVQPAGLLGRKVFVPPDRGQ